jgi:DNA repair exonuclease SbcCD ATPase subunit
LNRTRQKMADPVITPPPPLHGNGDGDGDGDYTIRSLARAACRAEVWWLQIVVLHQKKNIKLMQCLHNTLAELTSLKETVTNISTEKTELQQSLENAAQEADRTEARLVVVLTAQKKEIAGLWTNLTKAQGLRTNLTEVQSANEKLQSANEKLQSANEKLHSANEKLKLDLGNV